MLTYNQEISMKISWVGSIHVLGFRQGKCLLPCMFSMYANDLEETFVLQDFKGKEIGMLKLFLLLYTDDIVIFSESEAGLQQGLDILENYCGRRKLCVNVNKTKVMIFKGGSNKRNLSFTYRRVVIEIVKQFRCYFYHRWVIF